MESKERQVTVWADALDQIIVPIDEVSIDGKFTCEFCSGYESDCTGECNDLPQQDSERELFF